MEGWLPPQAATPLPPPGWYQEPGGAGLRWWDGRQWTEHRAPIAPPAAPGAPSATAVKPRYAQKWWHIPLLVVLGALGTFLGIALQFLPD